MAKSHGVLAVKVSVPFEELAASLRAMSGEESEWFIENPEYLASIDEAREELPVGPGLFGEWSISYTPTLNRRPSEGCLSIDAPIPKAKPAILSSRNGRRGLHAGESRP